MPVRGKLTVRSGKMVEQHGGKEFDYEVVKWIKQDEYTPHDQHLRTRISPEQLGEAEAVYVKVDMPDGSEEYRYIWGPFYGGQDEIEQHIQDVFTYGSP